MLLVDDLQWSDEATLHFLRYLPRLVARSPILILLALRLDGASSTSDAMRLAADLEGTHIARRMRLGRLTPTHTAELLERLLDGPVARRCTVLVYARSEGVPSSSRSWRVR